MPLRRDTSLDRITEIVYRAPQHPAWGEPAVPYTATLKGTQVLRLKGGEDYRRMLGCTPAEYGLLQPLIVQWLALVYVGDAAYEHAQTRGSSTVADGAWKRRMRELAQGHGLYVPELEEVLDDLERYYRLEGEVLLGEVELTDEVLADVLRIRSSDFFGLLRLTGMARGQAHDPEYEWLLRKLWLLLEIVDDLDSYQADVAANSFNTLRLMVFRYGADRAVAQLRALEAAVVDELCAGLARAGKENLLRVLGSSTLLPLESAPAQWVLRLLPEAALRRLAPRLMRAELGLLLREVPEPVAEKGPRPSRPGDRTGAAN
ncbi:hypothetical protein JOF53_002659 [Crossiella equi]|uniref:Uncharacterized protein n=1 Tax=Crossiella equi TaxID=130796 RepID=A0ABS5ABW5_9PSEU|nr:hypothetical protein [Crossiella equi]MBP2473787.1 hypothetical protein [Crossiella equi]